MLEDAGIEPRTVASLALAVRRSNPQSFQILSTSKSKTTLEKEDQNVSEVTISVFAGIQRHKGRADQGERVPICCSGKIY